MTSVIDSVSFYNGATNTIDPYSLFSVLFFLFYILLFLELTFDNKIFNA